MPRIELTDEQVREIMRIEDVLRKEIAVYENVEMTAYRLADSIKFHRATLQKVLDNSLGPLLEIIYGGIKNPESDISSRGSGGGPGKYLHEIADGVLFKGLDHKPIAITAPNVEFGGIDITKVDDSHAMISIDNKTMRIILENRPRLQDIIRQAADKISKADNVIQFLEAAHTATVDISMIIGCSEDEAKKLFILFINEFASQD